MRNMLYQITKNTDALICLDRAVTCGANNIHQYVIDSQKDFTRNRKFSAKSFIKTTLNLNSNSLSAGLRVLFPPKKNSQGKPSLTVSAYEQRKKMIKPELFHFILTRFNESLPSLKLYHGYRLLAIDGSDFHLPFDKRSPYLVHGRKRKKSLINGTVPPNKDFCMVHANIVYDIANRCYLDCLFQSRSELDERSAALAMLNRLSLHQPYIVLMDRGYESFNMFEHGNRSKYCNYIIRVKASAPSCIKEIGQLPACECDRDMVFTVTNNAKEKKEHPNYHKVNSPNHRYKNKYSPKYRTSHWDFENVCPVKCRVVKFRINPPDSKNEEWETLVTNLNRQEFSFSCIKQLYHLRWDIESSFRKLKYDLGAVSFHSKKENFQKIELLAQLLMFNVVNQAILAIKVIHEKNKPNYEIDFKMAVIIIKDYYRKQWGKKYRQMLKEVASYYHSKKPTRKYARHLREQTALAFNYRF